VDAAGEGILAGISEALLQPGGDVVLLIEALDLDPESVISRSSSGPTTGAM
jgi:hypothetical protein